MDLFLGICIWGAPVGALWTRNLVLSTGTASAVVWLEWVIVIFGVYLSRSLELICLVVWMFNTISVLFRSILPLYSLGLPHIWIEVLK